MFEINIRTLQRWLYEYKKNGDLQREKQIYYSYKIEEKHVKYIMKVLKKNQSITNLIIAFTDMYETNSIFIEPPNNENSLIDDYKPIKLEKNNIAFYYLNKLKHFNRINKTNKTRVSFDIRIIPFSKYKDNEKCSLTTNTKFTIGNYYIKI